MKLNNTTSVIYVSLAENNDIDFIHLKNMKFTLTELLAMLQNLLAERHTCTIRS